MTTFTNNTPESPRGMYLEISSMVFFDTATRDREPDEWFNLGVPWQSAVEFYEEENPLVYYPGLCEHIAQAISIEPKVVQIYGKMDNKKIYIFTFLNEFDRAARHGVYKHQQEILSGFPEYTFDFYVIAAEGESAEDLVSDLILLYARND